MYKTIYDFSMKDINGKDVSFSQYQGKILLIVNLASHCGFTPQYAGLQSLYEQYSEKGFVIIGFPSNDFLGQEPGSDQQIKEFCSLKYNVTFPLFSKISVKGKKINDLYLFLTEKSTNPGFYGPVKWNFTKFLVGRNGEIIDRFEPAIAPENLEMVNRIKAAIEM